jgi:Icc-related predicted phosphoesterase
MKRFMDWFAAQPHSFKIFIAGNHDSPAQDNPAQIRGNAKQRGLHYLQDSGVEIDGVVFYGSPWQLEYHNMAFNLPRGEQLVEKWRRIPHNTDVLITHGPPYGMLDTLKKVGRPGGCHDLWARVRQVKPKLHCFGHIHESPGRVEKDGTTFINAACCSRMTFEHTKDGERMSMGIRKPHIFDLEIAV